MVHFLIALSIPRSFNGNKVKVINRFYYSIWKQIKLWDGRQKAKILVKDSLPILININCLITKRPHYIELNFTSQNETAPLMVVFVLREHIYIVIKHHHWALPPGTKIITFWAVRDRTTPPCRSAPSSPACQSGAWAVLAPACPGSWAGSCCRWVAAAPRCGGGRAAAGGTHRQVSSCRRRRRLARRDGGGRSCKRRCAVAVRFWGRRADGSDRWHLASTRGNPVLKLSR